MMDEDEVWLDRGSMNKIAHYYITSRRQPYNIYFIIYYKDISQ
jgi:Zn-finger nucleic acid-binding protein